MKYVQKLMKACVGTLGFVLDHGKYRVFYKNKLEQAVYHFVPTNRVWTKRGPDAVTQRTRGAKEEQHEPAVENLTVHGTLELRALGSRTAVVQHGFRVVSSIQNLTNTKRLSMLDITMVLNVKE